MDVKTPLRPSYSSVQPDLANIVIVGGGIMGMSTAWHLASRGVTGIVVLEQHEIGRGSSAKPMGGVRANFSDAMNVILGKRSLESFRTWREDFGTNLELARVGYLFLARTEQEVANLEEATATQNEHGLNSYMVPPDKVAELNPFIDPQQILAGSFSPDDGYACPTAAVAGYTRACQQLGVTILDHTQVLDVETHAGATTGVVTNRGSIRTSQLVCAAGAWSAVLGDMAGHPLPVTPVPRMIGLTEQRPQAHPTVPFTLDLTTTLYMHNYYNGLLLGISHQAEPSFNRDFSFEWLKDFNAAARIFAPTLENPDLASGWAGFYENTPDRNAIIGVSDKVEGFFYITGFSGHGFLQGPAAGEFMADLIQGRESFLPANAYSTRRFEVDEDSVIEKNII